MEKPDDEGIQLCNKKGILYVSNWFENTVSIIDIKKNTVINKIKTGSSPAGIFFENAQILLVANKDDDNLSVYNTESLKELKKIKVGKAPYGIFFS